MAKLARAISASGIFVAMAPLAVAAQTAEQPSPAAGEPAEIIVTATRRAEGLQDVPLAVSAFGAEQLEKAGIQDSRQLMSVAPSLNLTTTTSESAGVVIRLRGIGSEAINPGLESSVATFVDGVYRSRSNLSLTDIPGIERIEVLRGPQGTLFGKNTSAGLINVITKRPAFDYSTDVALTYGNYDLAQVIAGITGPIAGETIAARVDAAVQRRTGWLADLTSGERYRNRNRYVVRGQLFAKLGDAASVRLISDYGYRNETGPDTYSPKIYDPAYVPILQALGSRRVLGLNDLLITTTDNRQSYEVTKQWGVSAELNWDLGFGEVIAITAYRDWRNHQARAVDYAEADLVYIPFAAAFQTFRTFTQEVRLAGTSGDLDWLLGGFYAAEDLTARYGYRVGRDFERFVDLTLAAQGLGTLSSYTGLPTGRSYSEGSGQGRDDFVQTARSFSLFTHNVWKVTDRLSLAAGLRWTRERKGVEVDIAGTSNPGCDALLARGVAVPALVSGLQCVQLYDPRYNGRYSAEKTESELSGQATVSFEMDRDLMTYASYGRGYKAGGFVIDRAGFRAIATKAPNANDLAFNPEIADNYELGVKFQTRDRSLTLNAAAFITRIQDFQLSYNTGAALVTTNIPSVQSKGVEVETTLRPSAAVTGTIGVTYANARYGKLPATLPANVRAIEGRMLANSPAWTITGSLGWDDVIASGRLRAFAYADWRYQSEVMTERLLRVNSNQQGYATANARIGLGDPDQAWTVELWARNLTDARFFTATLPASFQGNTLVGAPGEPRTVGLTLRLRQ
jgi:outer membrane receptor protein involved in Fe transport